MTAPADVRRAELLFEAGRHDEAGDRAMAWLATHPDDAAAHRLLARVRLRQGLYPASLHAAENAVRSDPTDTSALELQALALHNLGDDWRAAGIARRLAALEPEWWGWHRLLALATHGDESVAAAERAVALAPEEPLALIAAAAARRRAGRTAEAAAAYERVLAVDPTNADARRGLADLAAARHRHTRAVRMLRSALALDPRAAGARRQLDELLRAAAKRFAVATGVVTAAGAVAVLLLRHHVGELRLAAIATALAVLLLLVVLVAPVVRAAGGGVRQVGSLLLQDDVLLTFVISLLPALLVAVVALEPDEVPHLAPLAIGIRIAYRVARRSGATRRRR